MLATAPCLPTDQIKALAILSTGSLPKRILAVADVYPKNTPLFPFTKCCKSYYSPLMRSSIITRVLKAMRYSLLMLAGPVLLLAGCGGVHLDREGLRASGSIAVVSVVLPRIADTAKDGNRTVLQAAANEALVRVSAGLATLHTWQVRDPAKYRGGKAVRAFGNLTDSDLAALFPAPEERTRVRGLLRAELIALKKGFIAAEGLLVAPRSAFLPEEGVPTQDPAVHQAMLQQAGKLCTVLGADAVAFAEFRGSIDHPRPATFIVTEGRTDGALTMAATLVVVDRTGRIIVDLGEARPGDPARTRDLLPLYRGAGRDSVKDEKIDLGDPKKKVAQAFSGLIEETTAELMEAFKKAAGN
jgi:hypothetical protein